MELRADVLLEDLRERGEEILATIDRDPLLVKRISGGVVLANASKALYTPQEQHQLYAKGIVYRRDPYRLVSLPLLKIYNLGERDVTASGLTRLANEEDVRLRFLRKLDGTLVQAFRADGRAWLTTRGMIEGAVPPRGGAGDRDSVEFDYLRTIRALAERQYPRLLDDPVALEGRTLVFEFLHPSARIITDYGNREALVLIAAFDRERHRYLPYEELTALAGALGLEAADALGPRGGSLAEQVENLLASLSGTDQEGAVLNFERGDEVLYRVKVKSPDYLRLLRAAALCTYERTAALLDAAGELVNWPAFEESLRAQGRETVPEEVLGFYREHYERHAAYLAGCEQLRAWAETTAAALLERVGGAAGSKERRREFAALATAHPHSGLLFATLDGRLDVARVRGYVSSLREVREALRHAGPC